MTTSEILAGALVEPQRAVPAAVERRAALLPLLLATAAATALAAAVVATADLDRAASARLYRPGEPEEQLTPHDLEQKLARGRKLLATAAYGTALAGPTLFAAAAGLGLALGFRLAGAKPPVRASFSAASWALVPIALKDLLTLPAVLRLAPVRLEDVPRLVPSSLAALAPRLEGPGALALASVDLFALWGVGLAALGMAGAAGVPRRRALLVTLLLYVAYAAALRVAVPTLLAAAPPR